MRNRGAAANDAEAANKRSETTLSECNERREGDGAGSHAGADRKRHNPKNNMKIPTTDECSALFEKYCVPRNIREHCTKVSELATAIARRLNAKGVPIDVELVRVGALMHDWMKAATLNELSATKRFKHVPTEREIAAWKQLRARFAGKHEGEIAYELLKDTYPEFAQFLLDEDTLTKDLSRQRRWEEKVVHYADWRVIGTTVVSLSERLDDLFARYNEKIMVRGIDRWEKEKWVERTAEKEICDALGVQTEDLTI